MRINQTRWTQSRGWQPGQPNGLPKADLVFVFGGGAALANGELPAIRRAYPAAHIFGCSTAGEICGTSVDDDSLVATAVQFEHTQLLGSKVRIADAIDSFGAGEKLAEDLNRLGLVHVLVLSDGINVNGSELVAGLTSQLPDEVTVTGGLSADGDRFQSTQVLWDSDPEADTVAAVGFYGRRLKVGCASLGGWDPFGPERLITRSSGNVLYELDGRSALGLYKEYLGEHADDLPASGLLFPLSVRTADQEGPCVVRTILSIDEDSESLTFAGDVPRGSYARLMKANFDRLIDGAAGAARSSLGDGEAELALLISCVGRKLVLKQRIEEEVEGVRDVLGDGAVMTGFYSYGEISPFTPTARCELHNQTMTITTFSEV